MELQLDSHASGYRFDSFTDYGVLIGGTSYTTSLVVTSEEILPDWAPQYLKHMTVDDLEIIVALNPELILIGTGDTQLFPESAILKVIARLGIGIDFMDTRAACRTYNVLVAEGRRVAAGIIISSQEIR
jgi:uncharacterized protein